MKNKSQSGFSLIELLVVVVIIGIIAAIAVPSFIRSRIAAENRSAVAFLSSVRSAQVNFYAQKGRYARLDELQQSQGGSLGNGGGPLSFQRGRFTYSLFPTTTTDDELKTSYGVSAVRANDFSITYILEQDGVIQNLGEF